MAKSGCRKARARRTPESILRELARERFTVFGRDNDEPAEIVDRLLELASK